MADKFSAGNLYRMSHMRIEADTMEQPGVMNMLHFKEEEEEDEDMEDQLTEGQSDLDIEKSIEPESERSVRKPENSVSAPSTSRQSMPESNRQKVRQHENRIESQSLSQNRHIRRDDDNYQSVGHSKDAHHETHERHSFQNKNSGIDATQPSTSGRIKDRRKTILSLERPNTPTVITAVRKRRLSVVENYSSKAIDKNGNQLQKHDKIEENKPKKMRISEGTKTTGIVSSRVSNSTSIKPKSSTPLTSKSIALSSDKHRDKKYHETPPITQYFVQKIHKCETCFKSLASQNEANFHMKTHQKGRCFICKEVINHLCMDTIHKHMISCFFLGNKISNERLARFFEVKLGLTRLTHDKIEEIKKKMSTLRHKSKKPAPKSKQYETNESTSQTEVNSLQNKSSSMTTTTRDTTRNSINDHDDKNEKKSKSKKTHSKAKHTERETNDEFVIEGNQSAALNWIDEQMKEKPFLLRNFEIDKPKYLNINNSDQPILNDVTNEKIAFLIDSIKKRTDQLCSNENNKKSDPINLSMSSVSGNNQNLTNVPDCQMTTSTPKCNTTVRPQTLDRIASLIAQKPSTPNINTQSNIVNVNPQIISSTPTLPRLLTPPISMPIRSRALSVHMSQAEYSANDRLPARRQSVCDKEINSTVSSRNVQYPKTIAHQQQQQQQRATPPQLNLPYITHIHSTDFLQKPVNRTPEQPQDKTEAPVRAPSTLKILTPDDLNSRAMNVSQTVSSTQNQRIDSPNSTENDTNVNNSNDIKRVSSVKRPRTKTTPMRSQSQATPPTISDDADISISVSLSKLGADSAELVLTLNEHRLDFDLLTNKRKNEVQSSLLKDDVWRKMLDYLKKIKPTAQTIQLFSKILPKQQYDFFINELKHVYGIGCERIR